ncbi:MAG: hypothetical protein MPJ50_19045 [Pirellulales bacterium]|nr:hypothetical protein [Pirellulales bacterium]
MPTTKATFVIYDSFSETLWIENDTGEQIAEDDPRVKGFQGGGFGFSGWGGSGGFGAGGIHPFQGGISFRESPSRHEFFAISHVLCGVLFGYLGGRLGYFLVQRRASRTA